MIDQWVICTKGVGYLFVNGITDRYLTNFENDSVGLVKEDREEYVLVWFIGSDKEII